METINNMYGNMIDIYYGGFNHCLRVVGNEEFVYNINTYEYVVLEVKKLDTTYLEYVYDYYSLGTKYKKLC